MKPFRPGSLPSTRAWFTLAVVASLLPFVGAFSSTNVFFIRDLGLYFWPRHLSLHNAWRAGEWPLWNSFAGAGQSSVADPLNQYFLLPVTLIRLLLPDVPGFNFWVAAPFPLLAVGSWLWLRRYSSPFAAFVATALFTLAGPVVSTADFPNYSWSVALIPWALWATNLVCERPRTARVALLAGLVALQAVAGEAVTLGATCGLIVATAMFVAPGELGFARGRRVAAVIVAVGVGVLLSAVQTLPLMDAARRSARAGDLQPLYWSAHPLALVEMVAGHLFGQPHLGTEGQPWMGALNEGREPLLYSLYLGVGGLILASVSRADEDDRRWRWFWASVVGVAVVCGLGGYTPVYPALQRLVPMLDSFRFPVKYLVFAVVGIVALTATGVDALQAHVRGDHPMKRPRVAPLLLGGTALLGILLVAAASLVPDASRHAWEALAQLVGVRAPEQAARWILLSSTPLWTRLVAMTGGTLVLLLVTWQRHRLAPVAVYSLCALALVDPLVVNADLNPTIPAADLGPPAWVSLTRAHPDDRIYIGGYVALPRDSPRDPVINVDDVTRVELPVDVPREQALARHWAQLAQTPAPWGVRQVISYDLPELWAREYREMLDVFRRAPRADRFRFLGRTGVRYCVLPEPPFDGAAPITNAATEGAAMTLYECALPQPRVYMTPSARVESSQRRQLERMFDASHDPRAVVLLDREPPAAAGVRGRAAVVPSARIVAEHANDLVVMATAGPGGGYLNLLDSFDPDWTVDVDGEPAAQLRANGLFRAVRLSAGQHDVRFAYRPRAFALGAAVTGVTGVALLVPLVGLPFVGRLRRRQRVDTASRAPYDALHEYR